MQNSRTAIVATEYFGARQRMCFGTHCCSRSSSGFASRFLTIHTTTTQSFTCSIRSASVRRCIQWFSDAAILSIRHSPTCDLSPSFSTLRQWLSAPARLWMLWIWSCSIVVERHCTCASIFPAMKLSGFYRRGRHEKRPNHALQRTRRDGAVGYLPSDNTHPPTSQKQDVSAPKTTSASPVIVR